MPNPNRHPGDRDFLSAQEGDLVAVGRLAEGMWTRAWRLAIAVGATPACAEDAVQDAFERAFGQLHRFPNRVAFTAWLDRVVVNRAIDISRRERRRTVKEDAGSRALVRPADGAPEIPDRELLERCLELPDQMRHVVALHYWLDMSLEDISACLGVPIGTVRSRLSRALGRLRTSMGVAHGH